jgi:hypothetical protein
MFPTDSNQLKTQHIHTTTFFSGPDSVLPVSQLRWPRVFLPVYPPFHPINWSRSLGRSRTNPVLSQLVSNPQCSHTSWLTPLARHLRFSSTLLFWIFSRLLANRGG